MNKYELVVLVDPKMNKDDIKTVISNIEGIIGDNILDRDDIGILDLAYEVSGNDRAYFLSLFFSGDNDLLSTINYKLKLMESVIRYFIYSMSSSEKFLKYYDINKTFEDAEEKKKEETEKAFKDLDSAQLNK
ncbi:30S ribosomal protein S6 [Candidatus Vampirococcus lugosii]|uniref:Small ribosomal subunit protein bS6 n=1 Tax=Candidatus Vampirococcus lugosii TaxID=2789015 RepID=A0ABS5QLC7_9BACT|nr:30S ribosomal protein S6 [Candidatus Vampirococcus lugosii]MBS8121794.1 Ribosomal protein S6 [Candidatus Vampirococcus lugosii]